MNGQCYARSTASVSPWFVLEVYDVVVISERRDEHGCLLVLWLFVSLEQVSFMSFSRSSLSLILTVSIVSAQSQKLT